MENNLWLPVHAVSRRLSQLRLRTQVIIKDVWIPNNEHVGVAFAQLHKSECAHIDHIAVTQRNQIMIQDDIASFVSLMSTLAEGVSDIITC